jgi:hypothetical protein
MNRLDNKGGPQTLPLIPWFSNKGASKSSFQNPFVQI